MERKRLKDIFVTLGAALCCLLVFIAVRPVFAQSPDLGLEYATATGLGTTDIRTTISLVIRSFLGLLGIVAVGIILYAGFLWMTAGGNEEKVSTAKKWLVNGVIGLIIILSAFAIVSFIFRAATGTDTGGYNPGGCPEGQNCSGGLGGGGGGGFRVSSIMPEGSGPGDRGYPKNSSARVKFTYAVDQTSVDPASFEVRKCNPRIDGSGTPQEFDDGACTDVVPGSFTVESSLVTFTSTTPCEERPDLFCLDGDHWYRVVLKSGIGDTTGRPLLCPIIPVGPSGEYWTSAAENDLCERAFATNNVIDTDPPEVVISVPSSPPGYCLSTINVQAVVSDDSFPTVVRFRLQDSGGTDITDAFKYANGETHDGIVANDAGTNPFSADEVVIDTSGLPAAAVYRLSAIAEDTVPNASAPVRKDVMLSPLHCCNDIIDTDIDPPETGLNCGDGPLPAHCGACTGGSCTDDIECASGNCEDGVCVEKPVIDKVEPTAGGPGTLVTIEGRYFTSSGSITFMGDPADSDDDVIASGCDASSWVQLEGDGNHYAVTVIVPDGAHSGPIKLTTSKGSTDDTTSLTLPGFLLELPLGYNVDAPVPPGICYLEPDTGNAGASFTIHGVGFGATKADGTEVNMGPNVVATDVTETGWTDTAVKAFAPSTREGLYPVTMTVGGVTTNTAYFSLRPEPGEETPKIDSIIPTAGPIGSYVTIMGSGFGSNTGIVRFIYEGGLEDEVAFGDSPACDDNWKRTSIIIKVPERYGSPDGTLGSIVNPVVGGGSGLHKVEVETAGGIPKKSNRVDFTINTDPPRPGLCAARPDNGPPGIPVQIVGEGFGSGPDDPDLPDAYTIPVRNTIDFPAEVDPITGAVLSLMSATNYSGWRPGVVSTYVPGIRSKKTTWPASGDVSLVAKDIRSSNVVNFLVQDCNEGGCAIGSVCCDNGSCEEVIPGKEACKPPSRDSAYGWRLSTMTLPSLPRVVEQVCSDTIVQSPAPAKSSTDACANTYIQVQFNKIMDTATFRAESAPGNPATVIVQNCGSADEGPACPPDEISGALLGTFDFPEGTPGGRTIMRFAPTSQLLASTWYRVKLVSRPTGDPKVGIQEEGTGRYLDGDRDNSEGGDYTYTFRVRNTDTPCELDHVTIAPAIYTIDHEGLPPSAPARPDPGFVSMLVATNCNPIRCAVRTNPSDELPAEYDYYYTIDWSAQEPDAGPVLELDTPESGVCLDHMPVTAIRETPGSSVRLTAGAAPLPAGLRRTGNADVKVKFADPYVAQYAPNCTEACVNAGIWASFNVPMDVSTLDITRVELVKCRNASCNPPFVAEDQPSGDVDTAFDVRGDSVYGFALYTDDDLIPNAYYRVRILGGMEGMLSSSGVQLVGLNDQEAEHEYFRWIFRTREDGNPCAMSSASITPASVMFEYVGERMSLTAVPRGAPDACDPRGQVLDPRSYDWQWAAADSNVIGGHVVAGFIDPLIYTPDNNHFADTRLDTARSTEPGCSDRCTLLGSQNIKPQCGNGRVERGEQCEEDLGTGLWPDNCDEFTCLWLGTRHVDDGGTCGDGTVQPNETCDIAGDAPGCLVPASGELGCIALGATGIPGTVCGDGVIGDGEDCDDGNKKDGDGCSSECLAEGTSRSCTFGTFGACTNFCGNGIAEPGEDAECEVGDGTVATGCDIAKCIKKGSNPSVGGGPGCNNGVIDAGEECDPGAMSADWCTARCLYAGSSSDYTDPSFCGDTIWGFGESPYCDGPQKVRSSWPLPKATVSTDENNDQTQVIVSGSYAGGDDAFATVSSGTDDVTEDKYGKAKVTLSCICDEQDEPQTYCAGIQSDLGCDKNGCCAPAPTIETPYFPRDGSEDQCRNSGIRIYFSEDMDKTTGNRVILAVDESKIPGGCGSALRLTYGQGPADEEATGWLARAVRSILSFFRSLFSRIVNAQALPSSYCQVETIATVTGDTIRLAPTHALIPDAWHRVFIPGGGGGVYAVSGIPLGADTNFHFKTGPDICAIESVTVEPASYLFSTAEEPEHEFTAVAHPDNGPDDAEIVSVPEYAFKWRWHLQPDTSGFEVKPSIKGPFTWNGFCEDGEAAESEDCAVDLAAADEPKPLPNDCGNDVCEAGTEENNETSDDYCPEDCAVEPAHDATAVVAVRGPEEGKASVVEKAVVRVSAETSDRRVNKDQIDGEAEVTAMLCDSPWPAKQVCSQATPTSPWQVYLPWTGEYVACNPNEDVWYPFWDPLTDVSFFYCRDGGAGDAAETLPALSESIVRISHTPPTDKDGLFREYLFTYLEQDKPWSKDAIGIRFSTNRQHRTIEDWYAASGFRGAPSSVTVGGYEALQDGRTAYVNTAAVTDSGIFTNVNIMSFTDGATPETIAIFGQILANTDFNRQVSDSGYCVDVDGEQVLVDDEGDQVYSSVRGGPISCTADVECRVKPDGAVYPTNVNRYCRAPEAKLKRDVLRIGELLKTRDELLRVGEGSFPRLLAGSYLPALSVSAWTSWDSVLSEEAGVLLAKDPVNRFSPCDANAEQGTCWNQGDQEYMCPLGSLVYSYQGLGGQDFVLSGSLESGCQGLSEEVCLETPGCEVAAGTTYNDPVPPYSWPRRFCTDYPYGCTYDDVHNYICNAHTYWAHYCNEVSPGVTELCRDYQICPQNYTSGSGSSAATLAGGVNCIATGATWTGSSCFDYASSSSCTANPLCVWESGYCQFKDGKIRLAGTTAYPAPVCDGTVVGVGQACGDGVVSSDPNDCEPGQVKSVNCAQQYDSVIGQNRPGTAIQRCSELCQWQTPETCVYGSCGDGVVQSPEICDDGALNGTYGNCGSDCMGAAMACGDTSKQPVEACECGSKDGTYYFNGILNTGSVSGCGTQLTNIGTPSCSWDCSGIGPRCGDGIINDKEICDGGVEVFKGYCSDLAQTGCNTNQDCPAGSSCGHFCGDPNDPLDPRRNRRVCNGNDVTKTTDDITGSDVPLHNPRTAASFEKACMWSAWTCTGAGDCGNGVLESGEECDELEFDGPTGDAGPCIMHPNVYECKLNVCGDGYLNLSGGEECDEGADNGVICNPLYDRNCTYCSADCKVRTASGGFCGNGILEKPPAGPEECDGPAGFDGVWYCVSDRKEHRSWGLYTGGAICGIKDCAITCEDPFSKPCRNDVTTTNSDHASGNNPDLRLNVGSFSYHPNDNWNHAPTQIPLNDSCDPDDDGDGVPDSEPRAECGPQDADVHGAYEYSFIGMDYLTRQLLEGSPSETSRTISIAEVDEHCDGKDNDCSGEIDDYLTRVKGTVDNGALPPIVNARVRGYCGTSTSGTLLGTTYTDSTGHYVLDLFWKRACPDNDKITVEARSLTSPATSPAFDAPSPKITLNKETTCSGLTANLCAPKLFEACDGVDNDCNGLIDDSYPVDMVFAIDASGSMMQEMLSIGEALGNFANEFTGSQHRFGFVTFGQNSTSTLATYTNESTFFHDLSDATSFVNAISSWSYTASKGAYEPGYAVVKALAGGSVNGSTNAYGMHWRDGQAAYDNVNARRFIVVLTDESSLGSGHQLSGVADEFSDVAAAVSNCNGKCGPDSRVNVFVITSSSYYGEWYQASGSTIVSDPDGKLSISSNPGNINCTVSPAATSYVYCPAGGSSGRYHCTISGSTTTPLSSCSHPNLTAAYQTWLRDVVFEEVCPWNSG